MARRDPLSVILATRGSSVPTAAPQAALAPAPRRQRARQGAPSYREALLTWRHLAMCALRGYTRRAPHTSSPASTARATRGPTAPRAKASGRSTHTHSSAPPPAPPSEGSVVNHASAAPPEVRGVMAHASRSVARGPAAKPSASPPPHRSRTEAAPSASRRGASRGSPSGWDTATHTMLSPGWHPGGRGSPARGPGPIAPRKSPTTSKGNAPSEPPHGVSPSPYSAWTPLGAPCRAPRREAGCRK
mmetsp:Transcript_19429/g.49236  ORF Transcript_19429/g.49236 Transcript_19429/m.49236 type:complete len:245 (-) Transcript_19429:809-1543(-)